MQKTIHQVNPSRSGLYRLNYRGRIYFGKPADKDKIIVTLELGLGPHLGEEVLSEQCRFFNHFTNTPK
jgi:hypothetical protein